MEVIFLLGAVQAFFLALLAFNKPSKSLADYILATWIAFMGLHLIDYYTLTTGFQFKHPHLLGIGVGFPLLEGPLMFVYLKLMIQKRNSFKLSYLLHALPFVAFSLYFLVDFYFLNAEAKLAYYRDQEQEPSMAVSLLAIFCTVLGPIYVLGSLWELRKHARNISNRFSYTEEIDLKWLKYVLIGLGFVWLTVLFSNLFEGALSILEEDFGNDLIFLSLTITIFFLGFFGIRQQAIYVNHKPRTPLVAALKSEMKVKKEAQYKKSGLKGEEAKEHLERLLLYMEKEKPYLNGKLSLKEVAAHLHISSNHLSQVINEQLSKNFFDFVNEYRVEEVKKRLGQLEHEKFTLLSIAYSSGFNSKTSFNTIFKKNTGFTPSEYIERL